MRIAVCDDDPYEREQMIQALRAWDPAAQAECFSDGASLLAAARRTPPFDIVFLDIYMPGENGVEIAGHLRKTSSRTGLVFVTNSEDHALDAFSLSALHYLVKPVTAQGVAEAFRRLKELRPELMKTISLTVGRNTQTVPMDHICYLASASHAVEIVLAEDQKLRVWTPLGELEQKLSRNFLKINRGIIVNMDYIEEMRTKSCIMQNGQELFLAVRERGAICAAYQDYLLDRLSRKKGGQEL